MPQPAKEQDINYQPKTEGFSYQNPQSKLQELHKKRLSTFITLVLGIFRILLLFLIVLIILNYFNILSVSNIYPNRLVWLPHITKPVKENVINENSAQNTDQPIFSPQSKAWVAKGTLYEYNDNIIQIKTGNQIIKLTFSYENSTFYKQTSTP